MTKKELLAIYSELRKYLNVGILATGLLATCEDLGQLRNKIIRLGEVTVPLADCLDRISPTGKPPSKDLIENMLVLLVRTVFKESFGALKMYGEETDQWAGKLERQDWYQYMRMMRNSMEKSSLLDQRFAFTPNDITNNLPIDWNGRRLDPAMNDLAIDFDSFSPLNAMELLDTAEDYIMNEMK